MAVEEAKELERLSASVARLERQLGDLARTVERQDAKLDQLLELTVPAATEGPSLPELLAALVRHTGDSRELLVRIHRQLEEMGEGSSM